jgi:hypothetical protein
VSDEIDDKLNYAQSLYTNVLDWYRSAESKAQVLLAIDGTFLAFLTGLIFIVLTLILFLSAGISYLVRSVQ